tara:strand:+ start:1321 stop:1764 length:444 start_codon:yes stop_codon:yes gene_type:complete
MKITKWMKIEADGSVGGLLDSKPTLKEMQEWVGGLIEFAPISSKTNWLPVQNPEDLSTLYKGKVLEVICNEEGLLMSLGANAVATWATFNSPVNRVRYPIVGKCIIKYSIDCDKAEEISFNEFASVALMHDEIPSFARNKAINRSDL